MAAENFDKVFAREMVYEGGKVDDKHDPGGRTNKGVTQLTYNAYRSALGLPKKDVWLADDAEIKAIYKKLYWNPIHGDDLPAGLDMVIMDAAINSGVAQAAKWVQRALGAAYKGMIDGFWGAKTLVAILHDADHDALIEAFSSRRLATLKTLKGWKRYGKGWGARIVNSTKIAQAWATGSVGPMPVAVHLNGGNQKADVQTVVKPLVSIPQGLTITAAGTVGDTLSQLAQAFDPVKSFLPWVATGCAVITAAGAAITIIAHVVKESGLKAQDGASDTVLDFAADEHLDPVPVNDNEPPAPVPVAA
jgi:lysozyme family protein